MAWKEVTVLSSRQDFVNLALGDGANISELCRRFGISRKTGYKWIGRYKTDGDSGLADQSRRPLGSPKTSAPRVEEMVLDLREEHKAWGGRKLRRRLLDLGNEYVPSGSTITEILRRHDKLDERECLQHKPWQVFEHENPNDLWQMDFKGHFAIGSGRCHPLNAIDDCSRFAVMLKACGDQRAITVKQCLISAFETYGLPRRMLMDNGSPWGRPGDSYSPIEVWLIRLGIGIGHGRPYHPQTQGKVERLNKTLETELIGQRHFVDLIDSQNHFDQWREVYNHKRPHQSLEMEVPAKRYVMSTRAYPATLEAIEYASQDYVRKVQGDGKIYFKGSEYCVGKAFFGYPVAVRPTVNDGEFDVFFCHQKVSSIDLNNNKKRDMDV